MAMPAVNTVQSSERVISLKKGFIVRADSMPTKILLAAQSDSAPEIRISFEKTKANFLMNQGIILRKYSTDIRAEKKIIVGRA